MGQVTGGEQQYPVVQVGYDEPIPAALPPAPSPQRPAPHSLEPNSHPSDQSAPYQSPNQFLPTQAAPFTEPGPFPLPPVGSIAAIPSPAPAAGPTWIYPDQDESGERVFPVQAIPDWAAPARDRPVPSSQRQSVVPGFQPPPSVGLPAATGAVRRVSFQDAPSPRDRQPLRSLQSLNEVPDAQMPVRPEVLRPPGDVVLPEEPAGVIGPEPLLRLGMDPPTGYSGPSSVIPSEGQETSDFVPIEDRWRMGFPEWDRYGNGHPPVDDYPYVEGEKWNPFQLNVLKGDYPIIGQHTFLDITASSISLFEGHQVPTPTTPFESTGKPGETDFFGNPNQFVFVEDMALSIDLSHGDAGFKPTDWRIHLTPIFNMNYVQVRELGVVLPDVTRGSHRSREDYSLEEYFVETKLADLSPDYDFVSLRAGSQPFNSDFRGFIFSDTNRAIRLFGTRLSNREQFNAILFDQTEKDTNSLLNTFEDRHQNTFILNYYRQDFVWPGYTTQFSFHYNHDEASTKFDKNGFLVRPDPVGVFQPHAVDAYYMGWTGDGHINRFNIDHAFYWVLGRDTLNPLAGQPVSIDAQMAAAEVSYDRDWIRFRQSLFYASGDKNIDDNRATGFDAIFDNPNFAGGEFSYWQRQAIKLFGVNLVNRGSLLPDLRSSKIQGQTNFVNPGLELYNLGMDFEITPKLRLISNVNFLWFDHTNVLEQFVFQEKVHRFIGTDLSLGSEYRPLLSNNAILVGGISGLIPGQGFRDLYDPIVGRVHSLFAGFMEVTLAY